MAFDLPTAKIRLGIPADDDSKDAAITACLAMSMSMAEMYCDRGFEFKTETQEIHGLEQNILRTYRYPITEVTGVRSVSPGAIYDWSLTGAATVFKKSGEIVLSGSISGTQVLVDYSGGYAILPSDLEWALWGIFDAIWYSTPGMGIDPGDDSANDPGTIKSFWINGVRLEYATASSSSASAANAKEELYGLLPLPSIAVLSRYRAESALSGG